ncbi:unnamed protein product [Sphagnum tenellum]
MGMDIEEYMSLLSSLAAQHSPPHERHNSRPSASKYILLALAAGIRQFLFGYDPGAASMTARLYIAEVSPADKRGSTCDL